MLRLLKEDRISFRDKGVYKWSIKYGKKKCIQKELETLSDTTSEEMQQTPSTMINSFQSYRFQFSGLDLEERVVLFSLIHELGGFGHDLGSAYEPHTTHVVAEKCLFSEKTMAAMASGKWIVHKDFIYDSHRVGYWLSEKNYEIGHEKLNSDDVNSSSDESCDSITEIEEKHNGPRKCRELVLVKGHSMFFDWNVGILMKNKNQRDTFKRILKAGGANVLVLMFPLPEITISKCTLKCVFVCETSEDYEPLRKIGIPCIKHTYIHHYLYKHSLPSMEDYNIENSRNGNDDKYRDYPGAENHTFSIQGSIVTRRQNVNYGRCTSYEENSSASSIRDLEATQKLSLNKDTKYSIESPCADLRMKKYRSPLRSPGSYHGNILQPSEINTHTDEGLESVCLSSNENRNISSVDTCPENESALINFNGVLSVQETSVDSYVKKCSYYRQDNNNSKNDENFISTQYAPLHLPNSDRLNPVPIKRKLFETSDCNIKNLHEWDYSAKFANAHIQKKRSGLSDNINSPRSTVICERNESELRNPYSRIPKEGGSLPKKQVPVKVNVEKSYANSNVHSCLSDSWSMHSNNSSEDNRANNRIHSFNDVQLYLSCTVEKNFVVDSGSPKGNGSSRALSNTKHNSPSCKVDLEFGTPKRKKIEDSDQHVKFKSSPTTPQSKRNFSTSFKRKFGTPQTNKIDKYLIQENKKHLEVNNSCSPVVNSKYVISKDCYHRQEEDNVRSSGRNVVSRQIIDDDVRNVSTVTNTNQNIKYETIVKRNCCKRKLLVDVVNGDGENHINLNESNVSVNIEVVKVDKTHYKTETGGESVEVTSHKLPNGIQGNHEASNESLQDVISVSSDDDDDCFIVSDASCDENTRSEVHELDGNDSDVVCLEDVLSQNVLSKGRVTKKRDLCKSATVLDTRVCARKNASLTCKTNVLVFDSNSGNESTIIYNSNNGLEVVHNLHGDPIVKHNSNSEAEFMHSPISKSVSINNSNSKLDIVHHPDNEKLTENHFDSKPLNVVNYNNSSLVINNSWVDYKNSVDKSLTLSHPNNDSVSVPGPKKNLVIGERLMTCISSDNESQISFNSNKYSVHVTSSIKKQMINNNANMRLAVDESYTELGNAVGTFRESLYDVSSCMKLEAINLCDTDSEVEVSASETMVVDRSRIDHLTNSILEIKDIVGSKCEVQLVNGTVSSEGPVINSSCKELMHNSKCDLKTPTERTFRKGDSGNIFSVGFCSETGKIIQGVCWTADERNKKDDGKLQIRNRTAEKGKKLSKSGELIASYQRVMNNHHDNVAVRMKLKWISPCCLDPYSCIQRHRNNLYKPLEVCDARNQMMEALICAKQWFPAFDFCCSITSERNYPNVSTVLCILDLLLNTHEVELIGPAVSTFKKIVTLHPPCASYMLNYYTSVLTDTLGEATPEISRSGILYDIICKLKDMLSLPDSQREQEGDKEKDFRLVDVDANGNSESSNISCNENFDKKLFSLSVVTEKEKNYRNLNYDEKLNRLFLVLEIIVELLETDLSVFLVKHSFNVRKALSLRSHKPLIVSVIWSTENAQGIGCLNTLCRSVINIYAKCCDGRINFNKRIVISRLLNVVAEAVQASDADSDMYYPYFGEHCKSLALEVKHSMSDLRPQDFIHAIGDLVPILTLHVANNFLSSAVKCNTSPALNTVIEFLPQCSSPHEEKAIKMSHEVPATLNCKVEGNKKGVNKRDSKGETILHRVCRQNNVTKLRDLLKIPDVDVNIQDYGGWTALHEAIVSGGVDCVRELLEYNPPHGQNKTDLHIPSSDGTTPLIDAAQRNMLESCKLLLKYGGTSLLKDVNKKGKNALQAAHSHEVICLLKSFSVSDKLCDTTASAGEEKLFYKPSGPLSPLVPLLLPIILQAYLASFNTLDIIHNIKHCKENHGCINDVYAARKGKPKLKFEYERFLKDYRKLRKLKSLLKYLKTQGLENICIKKISFLLH